MIATKFPVWNLNSKLDDQIFDERNHIHNREKDPFIFHYRNRSPDLAIY